VGILAADMRTKTHHHGFGEDQPRVMSRFGRIFLSSTCWPETMKRVCARAPAARLKISGTPIHSISHGPVARSPWSAAQRARVWRQLHKEPEGEPAPSRRLADPKSLSLGRAEMEEISHFLKHSTPSGDMFEAIARVNEDIAAIARAFVR